MDSEIYIVATGVRTPLGLLSAPSAAAVRAGIVRIEEHPLLTDHAGESIVGARDRRLDPSLIGPERLIAMARTALDEVCAPLLNVSAASRRLPLFLGLPEARPGFTEQDARQVQRGLSSLPGLPIEFAPVRLYLGGHAAGVSALSDAVTTLRQGAVGACLVGGIDSYFHPHTIAWLDGHRQIAGASSRAGFVPGEGAGFCLLMTALTSRQLRVRPPASIRSVALGEETKLIKTPAVCLGEALTATVRRALDGAEPSIDKISDVICDINGERYRSEEWGFASLRLGPYFDNPSAFRSPAENWGDMGAASCPLFAMLACQAALRGYCRGPRTMLWTSSESGLRGAAVLGMESWALQ